MCCLCLRDQGYQFYLEMVVVDVGEDIGDL
jgi:hypothetical protein